MGYGGCICGDIKRIALDRNGKAIVGVSTSFNHIGQIRSLEKGVL